MKTMHAQNGSSLVETMVALSVLAIGLLGYTATIISSVNFEQRSYVLSQAVYMSGSILDRMRANREEVSEYALNLTDHPSTGKDCTAETCNGEEMAQWDLLQWMNVVEAELPGGDAEIDVSTDAGITQVSISIFYTLKKGSADSESETLLGKLQNYTVSTEI